MIHIQPDLVSDFGVPFGGKAQTSTGEVWWYVSDGKRYPLTPAKPSTNASVVARP